MDYYEILGVDHSGSYEDIKRAYKRLALQHHPDRNIKNREYSEHMFKDISRAYEVLSDSKLRNQYDNNQYISQSSISDPFSLFSKLFTTLYPEIINYLDIIERGDYDALIKKIENSCLNDLLSFPLEVLVHILKKQDVLNTKYSHKIEKIPKRLGYSLVEEKAPSTTALIEIELSYYHSHKYKKVTLILKKRSTVDNRGLVDVKREFILNLSLDEQVFEFGGNEDNINQYPGDLIFIMSDKKHESFSRQGEYNLVYDCNITFQDFKNGFRKRVSLFDRSVNIYISKPWESFMVYKLEGYGMNNFDSNTNGELIIKLVICPTNKDIDNPRLCNCIEPTKISLI